MVKPLNRTYYICFHVSEDDVNGDVGASGVSGLVPFIWDCFVAADFVVLFLFLIKN